ncbi:MAG: hypothetical protein AVDCRST_MAG04-1994, partial [uncultured Acetobacteraceae bacterium]
GPRHLVRGPARRAARGGCAWLRVHGQPHGERVRWEPPRRCPLGRHVLGGRPGRRGSRSHHVPGRRRPRPGGGGARRLRGGL